MSWQDALVALIVTGAVAYLGSRFAGTGRPARAKGKPDVPVGSLVRRGGSPGTRQGAHERR